MKEAFTKILESIAERIKPHEHDWELMVEMDMHSRLNPRHKWKEWTYRCKKCGKVEIASSLNS